MADISSLLEFLPCYNDTTYDPASDPDNLTVYMIHFHCSKLNINLTTCSPLEGPDEREAIATLCQVTDKMWDIMLWLAIATGVAGNSLAILTILTLPMSPATFYVCLLAISDLSSLFVRVLLLMLIKHELVENYGKTFNLLAVLFDYCASFSNWLLVLICFERFLTVRFPLKKRLCFTLRRAQLISLLMGVALLLAFSLATWRLGYNDTRMFYLRNLLYAVIPLGLILFIIALISCHLKRVHLDREATFSNNQRSRQSSDSSVSLSLNNNLVNGNNSSSVNMTQALVNNPTTTARKSKTTLQEIARLENSLTVMMFVAAIVFALLTIPHCIVFFTYTDFYNSWRSPMETARFYMFNKLSMVLTYYNLSINFILYFLSAKKFRTQLYQVFRPGAWLRTLLDARSRAGQAPSNNVTMETLSVDPIANGEYVSLRLLSTPSSKLASNGTIRIKSSGKVQFTLDQSYYD